MKVLVDKYPNRPEECIFAKTIIDFGNTRHICPFSGCRCDYELCPYLKAEPRKGHMSIDPKPLNAPDGALFKEDDTGDVYVFNAKEKVWIKMFNVWS